MRIRKHAAKLLLGMGVSHHSPPPPPLPAADVVPAEELFLCQLNCSPWDVSDPNLHFFDSQEEEEEEKRGNTRNGFGFGGDQEEHVMGISESITCGSSVAIAKPNYYGSEEDADPNKIRKRRRTKKMEDDRKKRIIITDTANGDLDSNLSQVKNQHKPDASQLKNRMTKMTAITTDVAASESVRNSSYFYMGLGSWRGKSRSNRKTAKFKELVEEGNQRSESGEGSDVPVAGDDLDDMSDDDDNVHDDTLGNNKGNIGWKRRDRKPVKTRSLKSL